jgi:hypothetical protein
MKQDSLFHQGVLGENAILFVLFTTNPKYPAVVTKIEQALSAVGTGTTVDG